MSINKALTWEELADIYDETTGGHARTCEMDVIFDWAAKQIDKFFVSEEGTLHKVNSDGK